MKKIGLPFMLFIVLFTLNQCSNQNPSTVGESKSVHLAIATPNGFDTIAQHALVRVSGTNMDTIDQPLTIDSNSIYGAISNIPAGSHRFFEVEVFGFNGGGPIYYGSAYADIYSGQNTNIRITLHKEGGSATIIGTIEDYPSTDTEYVIIPGAPRLVSVVDTSNGWKNYVFSIDSSFNSLGHPLEYGWRNEDNPHYFDSLSNDSVGWSSHDLVSTIFRTNSGTYYVRVKARCKLHPWIVSEWSQPLIINTSDTSVVPPIDTMPPLDTEYVIIPGAPRLVSVVDTSNGWKNYVFSIDSAFNSIGHPLEYGWRNEDNPHYFDSLSNDSVGWSSHDLVSTIFRTNSGTYYVRVKARCKLHPWIVSEWSQPLIINTNDTSVVPPIDTMIVIDTMPPYQVIDSFQINFKAKDRIKPTDILLHAGDQVEIFASGSWNMDTRRLKNCGPAGDSTGRNDSLALFPFFQSGALLGEFNDVSDTAFYIGFSKNVVAPGTTHLLLLANCRAPALQGNESGKMQVTVRVKRHSN